MLKRLGYAFATILFANEMRLAAVVSVLLFSSCGLLQKKTIPGPEVGPKQFFSVADHPEFQKALVLEYSFTQNSDQQLLSVYPHSDSAYAFDFMLENTKGSFVVDDSARVNGRHYLADFSESASIAGKNTLWLSQKNYSELLNQGSSVLDLGMEGTITFEVKGMADFSVSLQDTAFVFRVVELVGKEKPYYLSFIPDPNYPLITTQQFASKTALYSVQNRPTEYNDFVMTQGCVLKYKMVEAFTNEYEIELHNQIWSDTLLKFRVKGIFSGAEYSYDFDYELVYTGKALRNPDFMIPVFSAIKGEQLEDTVNWFILNRNETEQIAKNKSGYMRIPHYAENPDDDPLAYEDTTSYNAAKQAYINSYRTHFELNKLGRIPNSDYLFYSEDGLDEQWLPSLRFFSAEGDVDLELMERGKFPLLLYYNDNVSTEIHLVYAGYGRE